MSNMTRWGRPSIFSLRRDIDDALEEFTTPRALRREIDRLFGEELSPRTLWTEMERMFDDFVAPTQLRRRIEQIFEPFGGGGSRSMGMGMGTGMGWGGRNQSYFVPELELVERDNEYSLKVDLPGVRQDDVQVSVDDYNVLSIRGERRDEQTRHGRAGYEYTERSYGAFTRSVELPRGTDPSRIEADYRDGVLHLHIPKSEHQMMGRHIPVRSREGGREIGQGMRGEQQYTQGQGMQGQGMHGQGMQGRDEPRVVNPANAGKNGEGRSSRQQQQINSR